MNLIISQKKIVSKDKRTLDIFFDPIVPLEGTDNSWGKYTTTNARDTIILDYKCKAYDITFTNKNIHGVLVTLKNIKVFLNIESIGFTNTYIATKIDTTLASDKEDIFKTPK